jgi:hypothetical protein
MEFLGTLVLAIVLAPTLRDFFGDHYGRVQQDNCRELCDD